MSIGEVYLSGGHETTQILSSKNKAPLHDVHLASLSTHVLHKVKLHGWHTFPLLLK